MRIQFLTLICSIFEFEDEVRSFGKAKSWRRASFSIQRVNELIYIQCQRIALSQIVRSFSASQCPHEIKNHFLTMAQNASLWLPDISNLFAGEDFIK